MWEGLPGFPSLPRGYMTQKVRTVWGVVLWEELHSQESLEALHHFSASWKVTGWKFCSNDVCSAHHLPTIFDRKPFPHWVVRSSLWASCSTEPPWEKLVRGIRVCLTHSLARIPTPHFLCEAGCLWILLRSTTAFLVEQNDKGSASPGPRDAWHIHLLYGFPDSWRHQYAINTSVSH